MTHLALRLSTGHIDVATKPHDDITMDHCFARRTHYDVIKSNNMTMYTDMTS